MSDAAGAEMSLDAPSTTEQATGRDAPSETPGRHAPGQANEVSAEPLAERAGLHIREGWLLAVCCVAQFMVILDLSIVNVALPSIQFSLEFSAPQLQWVVDAYAITFAGFLMLGGRAVDHFGQRRMFVTALFVFGLASLAGGAASSREMLIWARAAQGLGGALMAASSLAIITASFSPGAKLNRAIGLWAAMNGAGGAAGMLLGGLLTEVSWRWVLLINPPIAIVTALVAYAVVRERRSERKTNFDVAGALTLTVGQMVLVYGVVEAGLAGWNAPKAIGPILGGIALLVVFGAIEARFAKAPLIPFKEITKPLRNANNIVLLFSASLFPMWFVSSLYLQQVLGLSPLSTGLIFLPMTVMIFLVASRAGRMVGTFGVRPVLGGGLVMLTAGLLLLANISSSGSGVVYVMVPGMLAAAGIAMSIVPSTIAATQGSKPGQAGLASGLVNTSRQVGGGLGLAVLVTLATQHTTHLIGTGQSVRQALTHGFQLAFLIGAGLTAAAALLTFTTMPRSAPAVRSAVRRLALAVVAVVAVFAVAVAALAGSRGAPVGAYELKGSYSFVSAPSLHPPMMRVTRSAPASQLAPGYILTANFYDLSEPPMIGQSGPLILDRHLQPVWFDPLPEKIVASNLSLQTYEGRPALAWWQGVVTNTGQTESGEDVVVNQHYQTLARLKATGGWVLTMHEIAIHGHDMWVTANKNVPMDLSGEGGAYNGALIDSAIQEYDLKTGRLLRSWDALRHIPLRDSYATLPTNGFPWDAYHVNSLQLVGSRSFLVSMRNTWAAYMVDIPTGRIVWTLGGKHSDFSFAQGAAFQWQHDVTLIDGGTAVTMYDDHCCQITSGGKHVPASAPSRALALKLDPQRHLASLTGQYTRTRGFDSDYMGSAELLPNGNVFVGFGSEPYLSEYSRSGKLLFDGEFPWPDLSYRATVGQWVGLPLQPPAGAARRTGGRTTVYASWNGATRLAGWRVLAQQPGNGHNGRLAPVARAAKSGFETAIVLPKGTGNGTLKLQALDSSGRAIGTSRPFTVT